MQTIQKAHPILVMLLKTQRKYNKNYCWPAQKKIIEMMDVMQGIKKSRSTLNRWLACAQREKYLLRRRRIKKHPVYGMVFKSTLYKITIKGYRLLSRLGVDMRMEIEQYQKWLEEISPKKEKPREIQVKTEDAKERIGEILTMLDQRLKA